MKLRNINSIESTSNSKQSNVLLSLPCTSSKIRMGRFRPHGRKQPTKVFKYSGNKVKLIQNEIRTNIFR